MKKFITTLLLVLLATVPALAAERPCSLIWDNVAGQTYTISTPDQTFDIVFSPAEAGPCPQGVVDIYDGVYIDPVLNCRYMTASNNTVKINCGAGDITFLLTENKLLMIDPDALFMLKK